jgi:hypothetical protein
LPEAEPARITGLPGSGTRAVINRNILYLLAASVHAAPLVAENLLDQGRPLNLSWATI